MRLIQLEDDGGRLRVGVVDEAGERVRLLDATAYDATAQLGADLVLSGDEVAVQSLINDLQSLGLHRLWKPRILATTNFF